MNLNFLYLFFIRCELAGEHRFKTSECKEVLKLQFNKGRSCEYIYMYIYYFQECNCLFVNYCLRVLKNRKMILLNLLNSIPMQSHFMEITNVIYIQSNEPDN